MVMPCFGLEILPVTGITGARRAVLKMGGRPASSCICLLSIFGYSLFFSPNETYVMYRRPMHLNPTHLNCLPTSPPPAPPPAFPSPPPLAAAAPSPPSRPRAAGASRRPTGRRSTRPGRQTAVSTRDGATGSSGG